MNCYTNCLIILNLLSLLIATSQQRNSPSHVTVVGSFSMRHTAVKSSRSPEIQSLIEHLDTEGSYRRLQRYPESKFLMHVFVQQLATITNPNEIIINTVCPGVVMTDILAYGPIWLRALMWSRWLASGRTIEEGGTLIIQAATALGEDSHGEFIQNGQVDRFECCG